MDSTALAAALTAIALLLLPATRLVPEKTGPLPRARDASRRGRLRRALAMGAGASAAAALLGMPVAMTLLSGPTVAVAAAASSGPERRSTEVELRELSGFLDLFAACLDGGCATDAAMAACLDGGLIRGRPADTLAQTRALLSLGCDAASAWEPVGRYPPLAALATAAARSALGGVRLAEAARDAAKELRAERRAAADRRAARAGVAMTAPLALCFLPAFVCLGLAPTIIGLISALHLW